MQICNKFSMSCSTNFTFKEIILKRAADLAEALYSMPRGGGHQLTTLSPNTASGYTGQLTHDTMVSGQWDEGWSHRYPTFTF